MNQLTHLENNRYYEIPELGWIDRFLQMQDNKKEKIKDLLTKIDKEAPSDIESFYE